MKDTMNDAFGRLWNMGFQTIIPVIPPGVQISSRSSLFKRIGTHQDARGKVPGLRGRDGKWYSFDWTSYQADEDDIPRWAAMGASTGIKTGETAVGYWLIAIDADATDENHARIIRDAVHEFLGIELPIRVGRYPKALYVCRVSGPYSYTMLEFGPRNERGNSQRVEVLSDGRQFVAEGTHPKTGKPYSWPKPLVPFDELPVFTPEQIDAFMEALRQRLPDAPEKLHKEGSASDVNQSALAGDIASIRRAVAATPNTSAHFPSRESYRDFGYAIKAALPNDQLEAFEIWADWCDRWEDEHGRTNDPDVYHSDWQRMKPPFKRGAAFVYETAETTSAGAFSRADAWFKPTATHQPTIFELVAQQDKETEEEKDVYPLLRIGDLMQREPPTFLIERLVPQNSLGMLVSGPGVGKSFTAMDMALSIAHGLPAWQKFGITPSGDGSVIYIASEGSFDLPLRIGAWLTARGIDKVSEKFFTLEAAVNFMDEKSVSKLLRTLAAMNLNPALIVVDTVSRALPGADENLQKDMTLFIAACDRIQRAFGCAVMGAHHNSKSGAMRGSTVIEGACDFVIRLEREKGATHGELMVFKQKAEADGWSRTFRLDPHDVGPQFLPKAFLEKKPVWPSLVFELVEEVVDGEGAVVGPDLSAMVLTAMEKAWKEGAPWSMAPQARARYAPRIMGAEFGLSAIEGEKLIKTWIGAGLVENRSFSTHSKAKGLYVIRHYGAPEGGEIFG